jgi:hypothetical protein
MIKTITNLTFHLMYAGERDAEEQNAEEQNVVELNAEEESVN